MKGGSLPRNSAGFTIIEVMIFLAISGILFVSALTALSGKQEETEFNIGLGTLTTQLQDDLGNVSDGYYALPTGITCMKGSVGAGGTLARAQISQTGSGTSTLGTNPDCVLIGEAIVLGVTDGNNNDNETYSTLPIIGYHYNYDANGQADGLEPEATTLAEALPVTSSNLATTESMPYGITLAYMCYQVGSTPCDGSVNPMNDLGIFTDFNDYTQSSGLLNSDSQYVRLVPIPGTIRTNGGIPLADSDAANNIDEITDDNATCGSNNICLESNDGEEVPNMAAPIDPSGGIEMCFNSGSTSQSALLTIGGSNSGSTIATTRYGKPGCV